MLSVLGLNLASGTEKPVLPGTERLFCIKGNRYERYSENFRLRSGSRVETCSTALSLPMCSARTSTPSMYRVQGVYGVVYTGMWVYRGVCTRVYTVSTPFYAFTPLRTPLRTPLHTVYVFSRFYASKRPESTFMRYRKALWQAVTTFHTAFTPFK